MLRTLSSIGASNRVVAYTVHEKPDPESAPAERAEGLVFVRDGFNWWAFLIAPIWMLAHRMWLVFLGYVAVSAALGGLIFAFDLGMSWAMLANMALNLIVAFEADSLRRWTLEQKGWRMIGTVSGANTRECERRFFERWLAGIDKKGEALPFDGHV